MIRNDDWITELYHQEGRKVEFNQKDFYKSKEGAMVMTEDYHIRRGSCCGSGCKHCPYWPPHQKMNRELREDLKSKDHRLI
mgnify:CR=1 FL=1|jgi:hypothetical protein|tara:strand:+ start:1357 stop:1599 length:243 start_codon:yes stop_codon:yes gene_type:complete